MGVRLDDLRVQLAAGQLVVVAGAGVSAAATGGQPVASWHGLLLDGIARVADVGVRLPAGWADHVRSQVDSGDLDWLLSAAEDVTRRLGAGEFRRWLADTVGALTAVRRDVPAAVAGLGAPLFTTNYDGILEDVTGLPPVTWRDGAGMQQVVRGDRPGVVHLHGHWQDPASVVLGIRSYERALGGAAAQALQQAVAATRSLLFVGYGGGLDDPNFGALRRWLAATFPDGAYRHFRLCRDSEVAAVQAQHAAEERVAVLGYGPEYDDLAGFLRALRPGPGAPATRPAAARGSGLAALPAARPCVGRAALVADVVAALTAGPPRPVLVAGPGGIGKSTICLAALHDPRVAARFGGRRVFVRADGASDAGMLLSGIAADVGAAGEAGAGELWPRVRAALAAGPVVLALDNLETPWSADPIGTEELLRTLAAIAGLALVATMRGANRPAGVGWESEQVPPLGPEDARTVFLAVAGQSFASDPVLDRLLDGLDGVPLAIELLAYNAQGQPDLTEVADRWDTERTAMLERHGGGVAALSVPVSIELSVTGRLMTGPGRRLLGLLGQLPDGIDRSDLDTLLPGAGWSAAATVRQIGLAHDADGRLRTLAPVRDHLHTTHPPQPDDLARAVARYTDLADELGRQVGRAGGAAAAARLAAESGNMHAMIDRALAAGDLPRVTDALVGLTEFARFTGAAPPALLPAATDQARSADKPRHHARLLKAAADILARSDHGTARALYEQAQPLYQQVGDVLGQANCIYRLGDIAWARSDHDTARALYEQAQRLYQQVGNVLGEANCIRSLGSIALAESDHHTARALYEQAQPLYQQVGIVLGQANCIHGLGDVTLAQSDHQVAQTLYTRAQPMYEQVGDVLGQANCIYSLGDIARARSDDEAARALYQQALDLYVALRAPYSIGKAHHRLARVAGDDAERELHRAAAREAYLSIDRPDLAARIEG